MSDHEVSNEPGPQSYGSVLPSGASGELLSSSPVQPSKRNLAAIVLSLVAVLAVIAGGVAYVGYHKLASKGSQPDKWAPSSSVAFLKLDLDPAASEKIAALQFEQKFPSAPHVTDANKLKDSLLNAIFNDQSGNQSGSSAINYAADVQPWLGDRVAVAAYADAAGTVQPLGILQVTDAAKAKASLTKIMKAAQQSASSDDSIVSNAAATGFAVEGDYAVIGQTQAAVDAAVAAARTSNISNNTTYNNDIATLKSDRVLTGWADIGAAVKLAAKSGTLGGADMLVPGGLGSLGGSAAKGRAVVGLRLQPDYAEFEGRILGADVSSFRNGKAGATLAQLPAGTIAGVSISGLGDVVKKELAALEASPLLAGGIQTQLDSVGTELGIAIPDDVVNLLGNEFAAGLDAMPAGNDPTSYKFTAITTPTDAAKGLKTAQTLAALGGQAGFPLTASAKGSQVVITNDAGASGTLGDDAGFKATMSGMPAQVVGAAYVNLAGIWDAVQTAVPNDVKHLSGLGTYEGIDGSDVVFAVRLTVK